MASSQQHQTPRGGEGEGEAPVPVPVAPSVSTQAVDDLLDEIDDVLEENAEEFVRGFVQKGGH